MRALKVFIYYGPKHLSKDNDSPMRYDKNGATFVAVCTIKGVRCQKIRNKCEYYDIVAQDKWANYEEMYYK